MHVAYVCTDPGVPVFGRKGGSVHVQEVLRQLRVAGVDVTVFARRIGGDVPEGLEGLALEQLSTPKHTSTEERERSLLQSNEELRKKLELRGPFDFVYERYSLWSFAGMEYAQSQGKPGLLEVNAPLIEEQRTFRELVLADEAAETTRRCFSSASDLLAVSDELAHWLETDTGVSGRIHTVPNGVDVARVTPDCAPTAPAPPGLVTIGFVGSLRPWHGVEILLEAVRRVRANDHAVRLLIVGDGPMRDRILEGAKELADAIDLTGPVDPGEVPGLLASMDIAVAPYPPIDGFYFSPLKIFEYMASGRAIVASDIGQISEFIRDGVDGLLCPAGDVERLATALERLCVDVELRGSLGRSARRRACERHSWTDVVIRILRIAGAAGAQRVGADEVVA